MYRFLIIIFSSLFFLTGCQKKTLEERFRDEAEQFTLKNCPKQMDEYTTMDSCTFSIPKRTFFYDYTVKGGLDVDTLYSQELYDIFRDQLLKDIKSSIQLKSYKDAGITFCYRYRSQRSGKLLMQQKFTKKDYGS